MTNNRPYRSIDFNDERKWKRYHYFDDIFQVGIQKAIGYVSIDSICKDYSVSSIDSLKELLIRNNKLVYLKNKNDEYGHGTFWVGDREMIQSIIDNQRDILNTHGWNDDAGQVFYRICQHSVEHEENRELYHLITDLFNSWCLWCDPRAIMIDDKFMSINPYDPDNN